MAPKTKKGGKAARESEEEKALRLDVAALKAEEATKKKEEKLRLLLQERLRDEEQFSRINTLKIQHAWRTLLRKAKVDELRKDIDILSQNHEREIDRKKAIIAMLDRDVDEAEEQYQMALRTHLENVDVLIDLHYERLAALERDFERDVEILEREFDSERNEIKQQHARERQELLDIMAGMESEYNDAEAEARQEFQSQRDDIKNKDQEEYNVLRITLESQIEDLERHFENAYQTYIANTEQRTQAYKMLTLKDQESAKKIETQQRRLHRIQDQLGHWKTKMANNVRECEDRNKALKEEKDAIAAHFQELKARMNRFREAEARRLTDLTINVQSCMGELDKRLDKAEKILKLGEMNRKLETEQEKVLPFYSSILEQDPQLQKELQAHLESRQETATALGPDGRRVDEWEYLDQFYKRYNKVLLDKLAFEREHERLSLENQDLRLLLSQYLNSISVNEQVLAEENPLLVVNGRTNVQLNTQRAEAKTVVDARFAVAVQHSRQAMLS